MISVEELIGWARENAVYRSEFCKQGWIRGEDLFSLASKVRYIVPQDYRFYVIANMLANQENEEEKET